MNPLFATLLNAGITSFNAGKTSSSALYMWTMARLSGGATEDLIDAFRAHLAAAINAAASAQDNERALRLDSLSALFDETVAARVGTAIVQRRAARCVDEASRALLEGDLEGALSSSLAALAFDPGNRDAARHLASAKEALVARCQMLDQEVPSLEGTLWLAAGAALAAPEPRRLLLDLLQKLGDFDSVIRVGDQIAADTNATLDDRLNAVKQRWIAHHRLQGADQAATDTQAEADVRRWLAALGPSAELDDATLSTRITRCFACDGYRQTLADLRELRRRDPKNEWVAYNLCVILFNNLHPDVAAAVDLVVQQAGNNVAYLKPAYTMMWMIGATPQALILAERLAAHYPELAIIGVLHQMATDLDRQPAHVFGKPRAARGLLYANLVCWGDAYIDLMERASIASLLAPGNIPALAETIDVVIEIFTMPGDLPRLLASQPLRRLAQYCEIRIQIFPELVATLKKDRGYEIYGHALHATALRAERDGADLTFLLPDLIYGDGSYARIAQEVTSQPRAIFSDSFNTLATPMLEALAPFRLDGVLAVPPDRLIETMNRCLSRRSLHSIYQPGDRLTCVEPTRVIFPLKTGMRTHGFMMLPVYVSHAALSPFRIMNFRTQDGLFLEHVLNGVTDDQLTVMSGLEFSYAEINDDEGYLQPLVEMTLATSIRNYFVNYGIGRHRLRLFNRPIEYPTRDAPQLPPDLSLVSEEEAAARVREIQHLFATDPVMVDLAEEQEKVRQAFYS